MSIETKENKEDKSNNVYNDNLDNINIQCDACERMIPFKKYESHQQLHL